MRRADTICHVYVGMSVFSPESAKQKMIMDYQNTNKGIHLDEARAAAGARAKEAVEMERDRMRREEVRKELEAEVRAQVWNEAVEKGYKGAFDIIYAAVPVKPEYPTIPQHLYI